MSKTYSIDALLEEVVTLPSLPGTVAHIMRLVSDPQCSLSAVAQTISSDPPLAIKTLRLVNTAYYGLRQKVASIEHAVVLLGIKVVKNLAFTASVFDIMKGSAEAFFRHSVSCGLAMRSLVELRGADALVQSPEEAFVCGLLHDIGKVLLGEFLPAECQEVTRMAVELRIPKWEAERSVIGVDHAALGSRLAQKWKLPDALAQAIAGHHDLRSMDNPAHQRVAACVSVADYTCCLCGISELESPAVIVNENTWSASGLTSTDVPAMMDHFIRSLPSVDELMRLAT